MILSLISSKREYTLINLAYKDLWSVDKASKIMYRHEGKENRGNT